MIIPSTTVSVVVAAQDPVYPAGPFVRLPSEPYMAGWVLVPVPSLNCTLVPLEPWGPVRVEGRYIPWELAIAGSVATPVAAFTSTSVAPLKS